MKDQNTDILISEAERLMQLAKNELERSEEDVTSYMVCVNARQSIVNYMIAYFQNNKTELIKPVTMAGLLEQCKKLDGRFQLVDIDAINCREDAHDDAYCLHVDKVSDCYRIAQMIRNIAVHDAPPY